MTVGELRKELADLPAYCEVLSIDPDSMQGGKPDTTKVLLPQQAKQYGGSGGYAAVVLWWKGTKLE